MKKSLFMLGVAVAALSSCSQNEVLEVAESRTIGFAGTGIDNITRGDILNTNFEQFYVYGGYGNNAIFNGISVTKSGSDWGYTPTQYWADGTWNFAGYAGGDGVNASWENSTGVLTLTVNSDASHQSDVVYAHLKDIEVNDASTYNTPVSLAFNHLLSKVQFKFTKEVASLGGVNVTLQNFSVSGITTNAKWVDGTQNVADPSQEGSYGDFSAATEIDGMDGLSTIAYYIVPQQVEAFAISAEAVVTDANGAEIKSGNVTATVPTAVITEWEAQKSYIYTAELKMENIVDPDDPSKEPKPIVFTGRVDTEWTSGGTTDPVNPSTGN